MAFLNGEASRVGVGLREGESLSMGERVVTVLSISFFGTE